VPRRAAIAVALVALSALTAPAPAPARAPAVQLRVAFDRGARLGAPTALSAELRIDPRRLSAPLVAVRLLYPDSLGILTSGLGLASCRPPAGSFAAIILDDPLRCPPNAVLGYGTALADVRLADGQAIPEYAGVTVLAGPIANGKVALVAYVEGQHPFGAWLVYAGALASGAPPFGGALDVRMPEIPSLRGFATLSLLDMKLAIGSRAITYVARTSRGVRGYHPQGIELPDRCPPEAFPFRVRLDFADGRHAIASVRLPCPPPAPTPAAGG
jgi:hypothetical protein